MGDIVAALVVGVAGVAFGIFPLDTRGIEFVEFAPKVLVEHGFIGGGAPAPALPPVNPFGDAFAQVLAVGD